MSYIATVPCALAGGPAGVITGTNPQGLSGARDRLAGIAIGNMMGIATGISANRGMGCGGGGCSCGGTCGGHKHGVGGLSMDGSGLFGTGIFGNGISSSDLSTWGIAEWATAGIGGYLVLSLVLTTMSGARAVRRGARAVGSIPANRRRKRAASIRKQAEEVERGGGWL